MIKFLKQLGNFIEVVTKILRLIEQKNVENAVKKGGHHAEKVIRIPNAGMPSRSSGNPGVRTVIDNPPTGD